MENGKYINDFFAESKSVIDRMPLQDVDRAIEVLFSAWKSGNTVFLIGNGGSASAISRLAGVSPPCPGSQSPVGAAPSKVRPAASAE